MLRKKKISKLIAVGAFAAVSYVIAKKTKKEIEQIKIKTFDSINVDYGEEDN